MIMRSEIHDLTETFFIDDESCAFTFDGLNLQWRGNLVSVSNFVAIDFVHSGNCCSEKRSGFFMFRKVPHKCEGHDTMVLRYAESQKKNRLRLASVKIRGEEKELARWLRVLRCSLDTQRKCRAREFLVFINPFSGRQNGVDMYMRKVKPVFDVAGISTTIIITRSRSDFGRIINGGIDGYDAILAVGGDGTVSEIVNCLITSQMGTCPGEEAPVPKIDIPIGIIPCGSTDCIAYTLNGTRDIETNALHAILGNRTHFDVCRAISEMGVDRFFVSVFTYGYLSDLIKESEKFRWMGPMRYNYAGLLTLLRSKEYFGQVDMIGIQFGRRNSSTAGIHKEEQEVDLVEKSVGKMSNNPPLCPTPVVPTIEPGSELMDTLKVEKDTSQCGGDVQETKSNPEREKVCEKCEPSTSEGKPRERAEEQAAVKDELTPNKGGSNLGLIPFRMEITPVTGDQPEEEISIRGRYFLIACANIACSSELTPNGIAPNCVPGDGNMNVVLFQPNSFWDLYKMYTRLTSRGKGSLLNELPFITIYQTKRVRISVTQKNLEERNAANCDGELFHDSVVDIKIHESIVQFYTRRHK